MSIIWALVLRLLEFQWMWGLDGQGSGWDGRDGRDDDRDGGKVEIVMVLVWERQG